MLKFSRYQAIRMAPLCALVCGCLLLVVTASLFAQARPNGDYPENVFQSPTREMRQWMLHAEKLLEEERYGEAILFLNRILDDSNDDYLNVVSEENPRVLRRGVKRFAAELIGSMPKSGRDALQLRVGPEAQQLLTKAIEQGDQAGLAQLTRSFLHTDAGYHGLYLLGSQHLESGNPLSAKQAFSTLLQVPAAVSSFEPELSLQLAVSDYWLGNKEQALDTLMALAARHPQVTVAGKPVALRDRTSVSNWLAAVVGELPKRQQQSTDQWRMYRGNPSRTAMASGGAVLASPRWWVPVCNDPKLLDMVNQLRQTFAEQNTAVLPALHPLVVNDGQRDVVLMRTINSLLAVDLNTARRLWMVEEFRSEELTRSLLVSRHQSARESNEDAVTGLERRLWDDATYGTISSDGNCVYMVQDLTLSSGRPRQTMLLFNPGQNSRFTTHEFNRLEARELRSQGKRKWIVPDERRVDDPLSDVFFLGPPLPMNGTLYVLGERQGEIRLYVLDADTGRMEWSQQLGVVERDIDENPIRRMAGVSPSYSDGVLICPTASGAVIAVDVLQRSLLWGYRYKVVSGPGDLRSRILNAQTSRSRGDRRLKHWEDASATVIDDKVLLTPVESEELICLELATGDEVWKDRVDREDGLYLAGIQSDRALIVGEKTVRCFDLEDGNVRWTTSLPDGTSPSGRGFSSEGHYYLPLSDGTLAAVDLAGGPLSVKQTRHGRPMGNLVSYQGRIISQGPDYLDCFRQLDPLKEAVASDLKKNPNDPHSLALEGELLWDAGLLDAAIDRLRRSYALEPAPEVRELLLDAMIAGLQTNFERHQEDLDFIAKLASRSEQQIAMLRAMVEGWQQLGETHKSFEACFMLMDQGWDDDELQKIDGDLSVRGHRWIRARFEQLRHQAPEDELKWLDEQVASRLKRAIESSGPTTLRQFLSYFGDHPLASEAWVALRQAVDPNVDRLETEMLLGEIVELGNSAQRGNAIALLAQFYRSIDRHQLAGHYYGLLQKEFADQEVFEGQTGREIVEALPNSADEQVWLRGKSNWPAGHVKSERTPGGNTSYRSYALELQGPSLGASSTVQWNPQLRSLRGLNGLGEELWKLQVSASTRGLQYGHSPNTIKVVHHGNLMVICLGLEVIAVDMLGGRDGQGRVLWRQSLTESIPGVNPLNNQVRTRRHVQHWGEMRHFVTDQQGRSLRIGPVTDRYVCFQRFGTVVALHPLTGDVLWQRRGFEPGRRIFGDNRVVIVADDDGTNAVALRAVDGKKIGLVTVPRSEQVMVECGRKLLTWAADGSKTVISLEDPFKGDILWTQRFAAGSKGAHSGWESLVVVEPDGQTTLLNIADGKRRASEKLEVGDAVSQVYLIRSSEMDLVVTAQVPPPTDAKIGRVSPVPGVTDDPTNPAITGHVHGFSHPDGKHLWTTAVSHQALVLYQPSELPVLVFACHRYRQTPFARGMTYHAVTCLDKRTGKLVYEDETVGTISNFSVLGNPQQRTMSVNLMQVQAPVSRLTLTFTDQPQPKKENNDTVPKDPADDKADAQDVPGFKKAGAGNE